MAYKKRDTDEVFERPLLTVYEASMLSNIGRDAVRAMAKDDIKARGLGSYAVQTGKAKILLKRVQFMREVLGIETSNKQQILF